MKILLIAVLLGVSMLACVAQPEPDPGQVSATQQGLCNPDLNNCPGWPLTTAKQKTISETYHFESVSGQPQTTPSVSCQALNGGSLCHSTAMLTLSNWVIVDCAFYDDGGYNCQGYSCPSATLDSNCTWIGQDAG